MRLSARGEMIDLYKNLNLNRILLLLVGLWPYQKSKIARLQQIFISSVLFSFVIFQLTTFVTAKCTFNLVIQVLINVFIFVSYLLLYNTFWYKITLIKCLLETLQQTINEVRNKNEIAIIENYGNKGKRLTKIFILIAILYVIAVQPLLVETIVPSFSNESQTYLSTHIMTEYFVDKEKYRYLLSMHMSAAFCTGALSAIAIGTIYLGYVQHICGMFRIASYRIKHAIADNFRQDIDLKDEIIIYKNIIYAVNIHLKAMKFVTIFISNFEMFLVIAITVLVICLSLSLYRILSYENNVTGISLYVAYALCILISMFLPNLIGQEITDHNGHVFFSAYSCRWYIAPLHIQKIILLLLQRGNKPFVINFCSMFTASLECFASLTCTSMSYFTVLYSTQQENNN